MKKNILIIRSANMTIVDKLIQLIINTNKDVSANLYCLVQRDFYKDLKNKYSRINYIILEENKLKYSIFSKDKDVINKLENIDFTDIYIPSSTKSFESFEEIKLIAASIKHKNVIFYNCNEEYFREDIVFSQLLLKKYINKVKYFFKCFVVYFMLTLISITIIPYYLIKSKIEKKSRVKFNYYKRMC